MFNRSSLFRKRQSSTNKKRRLIRNKPRIYRRSKGTVKKRISKRTRTQKGGFVDAKRPVTLQLFDSNPGKNLGNVSIGSDAQFADVKECIKKHTGINYILITYVDEDGDNVALDDEDTWKEAKDLSKNNIIQLQVGQDPRDGNPLFDLN